MTTYATYKCLTCKEPFQARPADRARGWARYCSKRCKAIKQEHQTGQFQRFIQQQTEPTFDNAHQFDNTEL